MEKIELAVKAYLFPKPVTLVGTNVGGKPNYMTLAYCNIVNQKPPIISISSGKRHYTNIGIKENGTFSVNTPSADMVKITDYCGLVSGRRVDKSTLFETFYGKHKTAPMIKECPLNLECKVIKTVELPMNEVFIAEIVGVYVEEQYLTNGLPDMQKINPIVLSMFDDYLGRGNNYWKVVEHLGRAWSIGKELKDKNK